MIELRIVDNVSALPTIYLPSTVKAIHALGDCIEDGSIDAASVMMVTIDSEGFPDLASFGEPLNNAEAIGYLELAKDQVLKRMALK